MANFNMNKVILGGRMTAVPEMKTTQSGVAMVQFNIAVNRSFAGKDGSGPQVDFITCVAWRKTAEFVSKYFTKGSSICVVGSIQNDSYEKNGEKRYSTKVIVDEVNFVDGKNDSPNASTPTQANTAPAAQAPAPEAPAGTPEDPDVLPF